MLRACDQLKCCPSYTLSQIALEKGLGKIRWLVLNWNEIAVDFYKKIDVIIEEDWRLCTLTPVAMKKLLNEER